MKIQTWGTRGGIPVVRPDSVEFGGNTTSIRVVSDCLPDKNALVVDLGSGFRELSKHLLMKEKIMNLTVLLTHGHDDHTEGMKMAPHTYVDGCTYKVYGVKEHGFGPRELFRSIMRSPRFPVEFAKVEHRFKFHPIDNIGTQVLVIHPKAGYHLLPIHKFNGFVREGKQLQLGASKCYVEECMVVFMFKTNHPEYTISYRFVEYPTGKVAVILTDHENEGFAKDLMSHVKDANLIIEDCEYSLEQWETRTSGFGHATSCYCAELFARSGANSLGLTHHDPDSSDDDVRKRLADAQNYLIEKGYPEKAEKVFACKDYGEYEV